MRNFTLKVDWLFSLALLTPEQKQYFLQIFTVVVVWLFQNKSPTLLFTAQNEAKKNLRLILQVNRSYFLN